MENISYDDHINMISESWVNGQKKQAVDQFKRAVADGCDVASALAGLHDLLAGVDYVGITAKLIQHAYDGDDT